MPPNSQLSTPFTWQAMETVRSVEVEPQATFENSFDSRGHIITQFLSPLQCALYPDNLQFSRGDLAGGSLCSRAAFRLVGDWQDERSGANSATAATGPASA
jgi:hypothetical protein